MKVPEEVRKCVAFVGHKNANGMHLVRGTVFFVARATDTLNASFTYAITAKHIIDKIRDQGADKVCLRLNFRNGNARWIETKTSDWYFHPDESDVDVALLRMSLPQESDHLYLPIPTTPVEEIMDKYWIGIGDEVCIAGLFSRHYGTKKNIPIIRVGNIAAIPEEPVQTDFGITDAYLIEARSTGGISGSPVFLNLGFFRVINNQLMQNMTGPTFYLLGLIHGHWDALGSDYDTLDEGETTAKKVNMGIAIVVPASKIMEVINQPDVRRKDAEDGPIRTLEMIESK